MLDKPTAPMAAVRDVARGRLATADSKQQLLALQQQSEQTGLRSYGKTS